MGRVTWSKGRAFFDASGLKAGDLADSVLAAGPLMVDADQRFWVYDVGVWRPDVRTVKGRVVRLLGQRYQRRHLPSVLDVLESACPVFTVEPVPEFINMRSGLLRWKGDPDPVLLDHSDACMSCVQLPIDWDTEAECPDFDAFMLEALPDDQDRDRAWQVLGYLMRSGNPLQRMFLLTGSGGNGKGVYLNVVRALLGHDNMSAVPIQEFSDSQFATAELYGKLANVCGDVDARYIENTARLKELCGDDLMKGERKFGQPFYFRFWGKAIFSANEIPASSDASIGFTRRFEVIDFPNRPATPDPDLSRRCTTPESLAGIARKAVHALRQLESAGGFNHGAAADVAHASLREASNRVLRWINDPDSNVDLAEGIFNKATTLLSAFRAWEETDSGDRNKHTGSPAFIRLTKQAGVEFAVRRGYNGFVGLRVGPGVMVKERDKPWLNFETRRSLESTTSPPLVDEEEALTLL
jgi:P4 family phage/plasmid primase-like protien